MDVSSIPELEIFAWIEVRVARDARDARDAGVWVDVLGAFLDGTAPEAKRLLKKCVKLNSTRNTIILRY